MSLKTVHLFFIVASVGLALMMGVWAIATYLSPEGSAGHLVTAVASTLVAALLAFYAVKFVRKARQIGLE